MATLSAEPMHADEIARSCRLGSRATVGILLQLELNGWARQLPGTRFIACQL